MAILIKTDTTSYIVYVNSLSELNKILHKLGYMTDCIGRWDKKLNMSVITPMRLVYSIFTRQPMYY